MGIFYGKEVYGIRCLSDDDLLYKVFELQFKTLGEEEKNKVKDLIKTTTNESTHYVFQVYRSYSSSHNFCANWDETQYFMWLTTEQSIIESLLA
jgi:hypothetical protein